MRHISGLQISFIFLLFQVFLFCPYSSEAQVFRKNENYQEFQNKSYYFGLSLGGSSSRYKVFRGQNFIQGDSIATAEGIAAPGFNVHMIANLKLGEYIDFRFLPGCSLVERPIEFTTSDGQTTIRRIESVFAEIPFHIRYKSAPYKDKRAFVVMGLKYSYDVASNSQTREAESLIKISPHDFQLEVGAGVQMFFPYFIFSPEIKYSQGLGNILIFNGQLEESSIMEKILSKVFTLSFNFEG